MKVGANFTLFFSFDVIRKNKDAAARQRRCILIF
jgi:hypothetical protein